MVKMTTEISFKKNESVVYNKDVACESWLKSTSEPFRARSGLIY
jgi:hypothetical protein